MDTLPVSKFKATCLAVLDKVKQSGRFWLGSFAQSGHISGDIVSPAVDDAGWEVLAR